MTANKSFKILSLEAKDLYAAMNLVNPQPEGYSIRDKNGNISLKKFENTLDWSLDTIKLQDAYTRETRKRNFYFVKDKKAYTQVIASVKFSYSYKEFNKAGQNTYVRHGYNFRDCAMNDGVCIKDGKLIAIQTNIEINNPLPDDMLCGYFAYANGCYNQVGTIPVLMNKSELRQYLYEHGFVCDGVKYVRYKRSSGSSRVGKCLFVNEIVAERMNKWDKCGLNLKVNDPIDLAAWEAYISLPMSSIIDTIEISPESILIIDDYSSKFQDEVVAVETKDGKLVSAVKVKDISNSIWDGESLLDSSMFGNYSDKGMLLLRNRFFKTCAFNTNIQKYFEDHNITNIKELNGFTLAKDIKDIKLITTPNSVKYLKFGKATQWLENIDSTFGIVKHEKETHYFNGRMVQCHYQLLNTLQLSYEDMEAILEPSLTYISAVRSDPDVLRYHIGYPFCAEEENGKLNPLKSKNDIVFKLLGINNKFAKTQMYKNFKNDIVKGFMRNLKQGHILIHGNYSTILGNGVEMLQQSIGEFKGESIIGVGNIYSKKFNVGDTILGSRSPHINSGNILLVKNIANEQIDRYFNLTNEIVYVNAIGENIQQRLNGNDYDSDTMLLTDNKLLIAAAQKNYKNFRVPTCFVESQKTERRYNYEHKADLDIKTSVNKIGEIVNLSQQLNSLFWERIANGSTVEQEQELYNDICKLAVLSGIEIDKAKKEFIINSGNEINWLKSKYKIEEDGKQTKPMFFKMITLENGYELSDRINYRYFKTPMDYLQKIIASANFRQARKYKDEIIPFMDVVKKPEMGLRQGYNSIQRNKIISIIRQAKADIKKMYIGYDTKTKDEKEVIWDAVAERRQECINAINKMSESEYTMYLTLKEIDNKECRDVSRFVFEVLFGKPNESFFKMIDASKEELHELVEDDGGAIKFYDFNYRKIKIAS